MELVKVEKIKEKVSISEKEKFLIQKETLIEIKKKIEKEYKQACIDYCGTKSKFGYTHFNTRNKRHYMMGIEQTLTIISNAIMVMVDYEHNLEVSDDE